MKRLHLIISVGFLYLQDVLTQFSKRNRGSCFLAYEYLKRRMKKVVVVKEFSGQPKTRLTRIVSGNLLLLVWKAEYELVNTKKNKVRERVRRKWDIETHLHAHEVWSRSRSEVCMLQRWLTGRAAAQVINLRFHPNGFEIRHYRMSWSQITAVIKSGVESRCCCVTAAPRGEQGDGRVSVPSFEWEDNNSIPEERAELLHSGYTITVP